MSSIPPFQKPGAPPLSTEGSDAGCAEEKILRMFGELSGLDRQRLVQRLKTMLPPSSTPRAGQALEALSTAIQASAGSAKEWTVQELKEIVASQNIDAKPKEVYNAISYMARRGHIRQVGYGRYVSADGIGMVTVEEGGLEPGRNDDD